MQTSPTDGAFPRRFTNPDATWVDAEGTPRRHSGAMRRKLMRWVGKYVPLNRHTRIDETPRKVVFPDGTTYHDDGHGIRRIPNADV